MPEKNYVIINTEEELLSLVTRIEELDYMSIDIETTTVDLITAKIICIAISWKPYTGIAINFLSEEGLPVWKDQEDDCARGVFRTCIKKIMASKGKKILQNGSFDVKILAKSGYEVNNFWFDTKIANKLLDENSPADLLTLSRLYTDEKDWKTEIKLLAKQLGGYLYIPREKLLPYNITDADVTLRIQEKQKEYLVSEGVDWVFYNISMPLQRVLVEVEMMGAKLDIEYLLQLQKTYEDKIKDIILKMNSCLSLLYTKVINVIAKAVKKPEPNMININSPKQLEKVIYQDLKLPAPRANDKGNYSTDERELKRLKGKHAFIDLLLAYRKLAKIKGTYIDGLLERVDGEWIHTEYNVASMVTGRVSSSNPNLQNIPRGTEIRHAFIAPKGRILVSGDMAQLELRSLASYSNDLALINIFKSNRDPHSEIGSRLFHTTADKITKEMRVVSKSCIFGLIYGRGAKSIAEELTEMGYPCNELQAQQHIDEFFSQFPDTKRWIDKIQEQVKMSGILVNKFGRKRRLFDPMKFGSLNEYEKAELMREAVNYPIQSTSSDIFSQITIDLHKILFTPEYDSWLTLTIHDDVVYAVPESKQDQIINIMRKTMGRIVPCFPNVPFKAEIKRGYRWSEMSVVE